MYSVKNWRKKKADDHAALVVKCAEQERERCQVCGQKYEEFERRIIQLENDKKEMKDRMDRHRQEMELMKKTMIELTERIKSEA